MNVKLAAWKMVGGKKKAPRMGAFNLLKVGILGVDLSSEQLIHAVHES
jgi:hypothetical protein